MPTAVNAGCGPVMIAGHDADDHGFHAVYAGILDSLMVQTSNRGSGILAIGPRPNGWAAEWIMIVAAMMNPPQAVTFANGTEIASQDFSGFALLYVPSDYRNVWNGIEETEALGLAARADDIATFVNDGGGLFSLTQAGLSEPWRFLVATAPLTAETVGTHGHLPSGDRLEDVSATAEGQRLGLDDTNIDGCCFHNIFTDYPAWLTPLATAVTPNDPQYDGGAIFLGGASTCVVPNCGDGLLDPGEECDDGNLTSGDGCSATCRREVNSSGGCVRGKGWWKTHNGVKGPQKRREPWPTPESTDLCGASWLEWIAAPPRGDAWVILAQHWIATSLNFASGAGGAPDVVQSHRDGQEMLAACSIADADREQALTIAKALERFNEGLSGTESCDDGGSSRTGDEASTSSGGRAR